MLEKKDVALATIKMMPFLHIAFFNVLNHFIVIITVK